MARSFLTYMLVVTLLSVMDCSTSNARPNNPPSKAKRMAQEVVRQQHAQGTLLGGLEQHIAIPEIAGESKTKAIKELLDVLGLKVPENMAEIALREKTKKPPKYMVDLYNAIADDNGMTRSPGLLNADTVRSIPNIDTRGPTFCKFDLSAITEKEIMLDAELHLFQSQKGLRQPKKSLNANWHRQRSPTTYLVKIYQVISDGNFTQPQRKLISARRMHSYHSGWHIFPILTTVEEWLSDTGKNHGLVTEMTSEYGEAIENILERESLQPILVVFTNNIDTEEAEEEKNEETSSDSAQRNDRNQASEKVNSRDRRSAETTGVRARRKNGENKKTKKNRNRNRDSYREAGPNVHEEQVNNEDRTMGQDEYVYMYGANGNRGQDSARYGARGDSYHGYEDGTDDFDYASDGEDKSGEKETAGDPLSSASQSFSPFYSFGSSDSPSRTCGRYPLYVDFEEMGWSGWIIHPQGYNAYHCRGQCSFPLGQNLNPSNHATVQSIMHTLGLGDQPVEMPCCAPDKLYDINLLYFDQNDYVVLRRYKDMVAASCACR